MKKFYTVFISLLLFLPINVLGQECTKEQKEQFKKIAKNIQVTYDYYNSGNDVFFDITFHNVVDYFNVIDTRNYTYIIKNKNGNLVAKDFAPSNTYRFTVVTDDKICNYMIVDNINVTLPYYNSYSSDPLCDGINSYSLCQKWNNIGKINREAWEKEVKKYKESLINKSDDNNITENKSVLEIIRDFIANYYFYIIAGASLLTIIIIVLIQNKKKNSFF